MLAEHTVVCRVDKVTSPGRLDQLAALIDVQVGKR